MLTAEIKTLFHPPPSGITLIITVGNILRSDDGVGPYIAHQVISPPKNMVILNAGDKPENIMGKITDLKPEKTIIIDTADFSGIAGEMRLLSENEIPGHSFSTHKFPLGIIARLIREDTGSKVFFLGIKPSSMEFGEGLSPRVKKSADELINYVDIHGHARGYLHSGGILARNIPR